MQKNLLIVVLVVYLLTDSGWGAHLLTPSNCLPCILALSNESNQFADLQATLVAISTSREGTGGHRILIPMDKMRQKSQELFKSMARHKHDKRLMRCEYTTIPVRHARAVESRGSSDMKRAAVAPDRALCHFKICNMGGRKRSSRSIHLLHLPAVNN